MSREAGSRTIKGQSAIVAIDQKSVLIIDDDPILFETAAAMLRKRGFSETAYAADAKTAFMHLQSGFSANLIILDLYLPDVDGVEILGDMRDHWSAIPILIVTSADASVRNAVLHLASAYGLDVRGAISKPLTTEKLDRVLL